MHSGLRIRFTQNRSRNADISPPFKGGKTALSGGVVSINLSLREERLKNSPLSTSPTSVWRGGGAFWYIKMTGCVILMFFIYLNIKHISYESDPLLQQNHLPRLDEIAGLETVEVDALLLDLRTCFLLQLSYFRVTFLFSDAEFHPATHWFGFTMNLLWSSCCKEPVPSPSTRRIVMMPHADSSERTADTPRSTRAPQ